MASIPQKQLFCWSDVDVLGDLERLKLVLAYLPDEPLMQVLEKERGRGRDDYPVRAVWNSILAGVVYQHPSIESLRRELCRNAQLRQLCGFDVAKGEHAVPPPWVYTRFLRRLLAHQERVEGMFEALVERLCGELSEFGRTLAVDGKALPTHARQPRKACEPKEPDGRRDTDADRGAKTYRGVREDGTTWEQVKSWFGYKLHLVVDAEYELPVRYKVTKASAAEVPRARKLIKQLQERHPELIEACETVVGDKGYDDGKFIRQLWDRHEIKPVIAIRDCWKDGEPTRLVTGTRNVVYDYEGNVYCHCPRSTARFAMAYGGFEKDRDALKYRCPARHYGFGCPGIELCRVGRAVRIPLGEERRVFTPLARSSYAWQRTYKKRTAVERVNSRLDVSFGFEQHFIRGLNKMTLRVGLALIVMLAMALGRVKHKHKDKLRSLVKVA
jgi:hypothetical protein